jgi:Arc/MetJ family transcription regulator
LILGTIWRLAVTAVVAYKWCMKRTNVVVDPHLLARARKLTGARTTREILGRALEELVTREEQRRLALELRGSDWIGSLSEMRKAR